MIGKVTVQQAADLAGVKSPQTIRNWATRGLVQIVNIDGRDHVDVAELKAAQGLRVNELLQHPTAVEVKLTRSDVSHAVAAGRVIPRDDQYSVNDLAAIIEHRNAAGVPASAAEKPGVMADSQAVSVPPQPADAGPDADFSPPADDEILSPAARAGYWSEIRRYILDHKDPYLIRPEFWDVRVCPEFIAPVGVFSYYWSERLWDEIDGAHQAILRTAGFVVREGNIVAVPEDDEIGDVEGLDQRPFSPVERFALESLRWRATKAAWEDAFLKRRLQLRRAGVPVSMLAAERTGGRRDIGDLLDRYHKRFWKPCDLPDWFWDTEEMPPFEPPTECVAFWWGEIEEADGEARTWIECSASWGDSLGGVRFNAASKRLSVVPGAHRESDPLPEEFAELNARYERERHAWEREWKWRRQLRFGED